MRNTVVSERYAQALFEISQSQNLTEKIQEDLKVISETLKEYHDFNNLLLHPVISNQDKKDMFSKIFSEKIDKVTENLVMLLIDKKRESLIPEISELYKQMYNKLHSRVIAEVYTSIEISKNLLSIIKGKLETYLSKEVEIEDHVDPKVIGGVLVKIGDRVIDGTIRTKFENMARSLR
ncbi:MAG: F0F1 ATP synthase subunit delta [Candidatus Sericytochromatia bacterium]